VERARSPSAILDKRSASQSGAHLWKTYTGSLEGGTAVSHGVAYVHTQGTSLVALEAVTGQILWEQTIGYGFSTPAVSDGYVFVGGVSAIFAFDAHTGEERWKRTFPALSSSPAVAYGLVYAGGADGLYAFDMKTGEVVWKGPIGAGNYPLAPGTLSGPCQGSALPPNKYGNQIVFGDLYVGAI
jgi:outer membrane protein assembly factor BamB